MVDKEREFSPEEQAYLDGYVKKIQQELHLTKDDEINTSDKEKKSQENCRQMLNTFFNYWYKKGKKPEQITKEIVEMVQASKESAFVGINLRFSSLERVLSNGEIKSVFELDDTQTETSRTNDETLDMRRELEKYLGFDDKQFPKSFAFGTDQQREKGPAEQYGPFYFSFSEDELPKDTLCIAGDLLNPSCIPESMHTKDYLEAMKTAMQASAEDEETGMKIYRDFASCRSHTLEHAPIIQAMIDLDKKYSTTSDTTADTDTYSQQMTYIEVLIPKKITIKEASELVVSKENFAPDEENDKLMSAYPNFREFQQEVEQKYGIKIKTTGELNKHLFSDTDLSNYQTWFEQE